MVWLIGSLIGPVAERYLTCLIARDTAGFVAQFISPLRSASSCSGFPSGFSCDPKGGRVYFLPAARPHVWEDDSGSRSSWTTWCVPVCANAWFNSTCVTGHHVLSRGQSGILSGWHFSPHGWHQDSQADILSCCASFTQSCLRQG